MIFPETSEDIFDCKNSRDLRLCHYVEGLCNGVGWDEEYYSRAWQYRGKSKNARRISREELDKLDTWIDDGGRLLIFSRENNVTHTME